MFRLIIKEPCISIRGLFLGRAKSTTSQAKDTSNWPSPITVSDRIQTRRSVFVAHASPLPDKEHLQAFLDHLTSLPELKKATHCMYAYRTTEALPTTSSTKVALGQNDGGESGAGNQLSRLLEVTKCENVVIVVSRWYGGVPLGSDRWRKIIHVAKEALSKGGFTDMKGEKRGTGSTGDSKTDNDKRGRK
ncbi:ribosomal protein S5 domain 2-like protein [Marasmius fiardii PR-910]|nr:ribosomal protein S5 domain 2-like protein [Marasmius fiardii PR-910]